VVDLDRHQPKIFLLMLEKELKKIRKKVEDLEFLRKTMLEERFSLLHQTLFGEQV